MLAVEQAVRGEVNDAVLAEFGAGRHGAARLEIQGLFALRRWHERRDRGGFAPCAGQAGDAQVRVGHTGLAECARQRRLQCARLIRVWRGCGDLRALKACIICREHGIGEQCQSFGRRLASRKFASQHRQTGSRGQTDDFVIRNEWLVAGGWWLG